MRRAAANLGQQFVAQHDKRRYAIALRALVVIIRGTILSFRNARLERLAGTLALQGVRYWVIGIWF